jgi:hypothetical protein
MKEEKIIVIINEDGSMELETKGIKGPVCEDALNELLEDMEEEVLETKKTPEFYQKVDLNNVNKLKRGK